MRSAVAEISERIRSEAAEMEEKEKAEKEKAERWTERQKVKELREKAARDQRHQTIMQFVLLLLMVVLVEWLCGGSRFESPSGRP